MNVKMLSGICLLQESITSEDSVAKLSATSSVASSIRGPRRNRNNLQVAKALLFDGRSQSDEEVDSGNSVTGTKGVNGPTTRRQWSEWVNKSPSGGTGKENQIEVNYNSHKFITFLVPY